MCVLCVCDCYSFARSVRFSNRWKIADLVDGSLAKRCWMSSSVTRPQPTSNRWKPIGRSTFTRLKSSSLEIYTVYSIELFALKKARLIADPTSPFPFSPRFLVIILICFWWLISGMKKQKIQMAWFFEKGDVIWCNSSLFFLYITSTPASQCDRYQSLSALAKINEVVTKLSVDIFVRNKIELGILPTQLLIFLNQTTKGELTDRLLKWLLVKSHDWLNSRYCFHHFWKFDFQMFLLL